MISANFPSNFANAISPFSPLGKSPVGEESRDNRNTPFKPVEAAAESARTENRHDPDERSGEVEERRRLSDPRREGREKGGEQLAGGDEVVNQSRLEQEQSHIRELATRDREVRNHEQAHAAVGGAFAGAPRFTFQRGPDGLSYAVGGEVSIDVGKVPGDPQATIEKAQLIRRAALAPADPSAQDRRIAARATRMELEARRELSELQREEIRAEERERAQREAAKAEEEQSPEEARNETGEGEEEPQNAAERFAEINDLNLKLNRRLLDIGVAIGAGTKASGGLLDQIV